MLELTNDEDIDIAAIKKRLLEITSILSNHSISKNRKRYVADSIPESVIAERRILVKEQKGLEMILLTRKKTNPIIEVLDKNKVWMNKFDELLIETIGKPNFNLLIYECRRRMSDNKHSAKVTLAASKPQSLQSDKDEIKRLRKMLEENNKKMQEARKSIDRFITAHEPEVNKADYIRSVSEINKCLPPLQELQKIKI